MKKVFLIKTISNTHVGSGDINYGVVDQLIQRDPVTKLPVIHSSGLKGALREAFQLVHPEKVTDLFGSSPKEDAGSNQQGLIRFFEARLLSLPVRSDKAFYLSATSPEILRDFLDTVTVFHSAFPEELADVVNKLLEHPDMKQLEEDKPVALVAEQELADACLEDLFLKATHCSGLPLSRLESLIGERIVLLNAPAMKKITDDNHLPVMARNCLVPERENLWYEQVLPRFTRLYFSLLMEQVPESDRDTFFTWLEEGLFQIGGNASIGYGFCKLEDVEHITCNQDENKR